MIFSVSHSSDIKVPMTRISTSTKIDPEVLKQAKHHAIDEGITLSELLEGALKKRDEAVEIVLLLCHHKALYVFRLN